MLVPYYYYCYYYYYYYYCYYYYYHHYYHVLLFFFMTCLVVKSFLIIVSPDKVFNNNNNCCEICHSNTSDRDFSLFVSFIFVCTRAETFSWEDKNSYFKANFSPLSLIVKLFGRLCYM